MAKTMQRKLLNHLANVIEIDFCDLVEYFKEFEPAKQTENYSEHIKNILIDLEAV